MSDWWFTDRMVLPPPRKSGFSFPGPGEMRDPFAPDVKQTGPGALERGARSLEYYAGLPSQYMAGVKPETPGMWSEEDEFRRQMLQKAGMDWGVQTGFGTVFDPLAVRMVKPGVPGVVLGSGVSGGGGKEPPPVPANANVPSVDRLSDLIRQRLENNPLAKQSFLDEFQKRRLAEGAARSAQAQREAEFALGPNPTSQQILEYVLRRNRE